jgi:hypothetical protein
MGCGRRGAGLVKDLKTRMRIGRESFVSSGIMSRGVMSRGLRLKCIFYSSAGSIAIRCIIVKSVECLHDSPLNDVRWQYMTLDKYLSRKRKRYH